ncbi:MAG: hypothetical protein GEU90_22520, partial [Gemmatimonas sp.]|nr:hypothetical protein [Gemmatimonas sp.]
MSIAERDLPPAELLERIEAKARELEALQQALDAWYEQYDGTPKRDALFTSVSGAEIEPLYTPLDRPEAAPEEAAFYNRQLGLPGEFPFTRGPY